MLSYKKEDKEEEGMPCYKCNDLGVHLQSGDSNCIVE